MSHLLERYDGEIKKYIEQADDLIKRVLESGYNCMVVNNDFLDPTVQLDRLPPNHKKGELFYYGKIKEALEIGLRDGIIPKEYTDHLIRAPP